MSVSLSAKRLRARGDCGETELKWQRKDELFREKVIDIRKIRIFAVR